MLGSPPGLPGGGMTGVLSPSGVGNLIAGSTAGGGQMTPSDCARRLLRLSGGGARLCRLPAPFVAVPGDPGGSDGEQGAEAEGDAPCPSAGSTSVAARIAAAKSAAASSQSLRFASQVFMRIQPKVQLQGSTCLEPSERADVGFYRNERACFTYMGPAHGCPQFRFQLDIAAAGKNDE
jgi:hypothetical protein